MFLSVYPNDRYLFLLLNVLWPGFFFFFHCIVYFWVNLCVTNKPSWTLQIFKWQYFVETCFHLNIKNVNTFHFRHCRSVDLGINSSKCWKCWVSSADYVSLTPGSAACRGKHVMLYCLQTNKEFVYSGIWTERPLSRNTPKWVLPQTSISIWLMAHGPWCWMRKDRLEGETWEAAQLEEDLLSSHDWFFLWSLAEVATNNPGLQLHPGDFYFI